ncbi:MAG: RNA polymerase sigma factor SigJ [Acidimicrobiales bacterium]|nr:RNA polymerase sigma factor SigJ [Acidimicrobiales bacterium]HRW37861.1 RNA polymerase sigma factor SigJ [Aquihabitans sp.]
MTATRASDACFERERSRLIGLAYRITGSRTVAEDLVQEAWPRWNGADHDAIARPEAWLTTVVSRLALDHLRSAAHQREAYVGPWLPEPVAAEPDPAQQAELAESLTIGFLAVLERLGPTERVVFLLADVFGVPFDEIAAAVGKTPPACRQIAVRARARVRDGRPRFQPTDDQAWQVAVAFLTAAQVGDLDGLVSLLGEGALAISDGGADHHAARRPVVAARIPRFVANLAARLPTDAVIELRAINGEPGIVVRERGAITTAMAFTVADGQVERIWTIRNPDKLRALAIDA